MNNRLEVRRVDVQETKVRDRAPVAPTPDETVIDGEIVALDEAGKPSFNSLQNYSENYPLLYCIFDVPILSGRDLRAEPLDIRRQLLEEKVLPLLSDPIRPLASFPLCWPSPG